MIKSSSPTKKIKISQQTISSAIDPFIDDNFDWTYFNFHIDRYVDILKYIEHFINLKSTSQLKILDVGPSYQTVLLRNFFPNTTFDTLGFNHRANNLRPAEQHLYKDLNQTLEEPIPKIVENYDLVLCCEVMEHIYTNPVHMLNFFGRMLKSQGVLFIQTPNAVAIHKRIKMLFGRNPYPKLEDNRQGHFREYTGREVKDFMNAANLKMEKIRYKNHFGLDSNVFHNIFKKSSFLMPPTFRDGMTIIGTKP